LFTSVKVAWAALIATFFRVSKALNRGRFFKCHVWFWSNKVHIEAEALDYTIPPQELEVRVTRRTLGRVYLRGRGVEVGAGTRPWPIPPGAKCFYGDKRDQSELNQYFKKEGSPVDQHIDAQTFEGIGDEKFDFTLSAHVLEHLIDPLGAIRAALRVTKPGGIVMLAVPDKRYTFDKDRPVTPLSHLIEDLRTGGEPTIYAAALEHLRYLHPQWNKQPLSAEQQETEAKRLAALRGKERFDTHFHTWTTESFAEMMRWVEGHFDAQILHIEGVVNENICVLRKGGKPRKWWRVW